MFSNSSSLCLSLSVSVSLSVCLSVSISLSLSLSVSLSLSLYLSVALSDWLTDWLRETDWQTDRDRETERVSRLVNLKRTIVMPMVYWLAVLLDCGQIADQAVWKMAWEALGSRRQDIFRTYAAPNSCNKITSHFSQQNNVPFQSTV